MILCGDVGDCPYSLGMHTEWFCNDRSITYFQMVEQKYEKKGQGNCKILKIAESRIKDCTIFLHIKFFSHSFPLACHWRCWSRWPSPGPCYWYCEHKPYPQARVYRGVLVPPSKYMVKSCDTAGFHCGSMPSTLSAPTRCCPALRLTGSRPGCGVGPLESPVASHRVYPTKLQSEEPVTEALSRSKFNSLNTPRATSPSSGAFSLTQMNWKTWWLKRDSS